MDHTLALAHWLQVEVIHTFSTKCRLAWQNPGPAYSAGFRHVSRVDIQKTHNPETVVADATQLASDYGTRTVPSADIFSISSLA